MDDSERRSLILVNPGLSPRRATVSTMYTAYRLNDPNEVMPPHRHSPSAIRFGLTGTGNFTGVERRGHHLRAGRHGAHPARHLAQSRQRRRRAGGQPLGTRSAAGRDAQRRLFRARLYRDGRRRAGKKKQQTARCPPDYSERVYGHGGLRAAFPRITSRRRALFAHVRLPLGADARADRALRTGTAIPTRRSNDRVRRPAHRRPGVQDHDLLRGGAAAGRAHATACGRRRACWSRRSKAAGHSIIDGKRFDWHKFDTLAVPGGSWFEHHNGSDRAPAILFVASDEPALKCFHLFKRWGRDRPATSSALIAESSLPPGAAGCRASGGIACRADRTPGWCAYRLPGRRPGVGRRHDALRRPHALAERHHASSTWPTRATAPARAHRSAGGLAFAQGARRRTAS